MAATPDKISVGILGPEEGTSTEGRGCNLWPVGYAATITAGEAIPKYLGESIGRRSIPALLGDVQALVWTGRDQGQPLPTTEEEKLCQWCKRHKFPLLGVDVGLLLMNVAFGGNLHLDLALERPEALQHRHPPEKGLRHAIEIVPQSRLSAIYGEGELVVNSEHRRGLARLARGFRATGLALDGIVEAIEFENPAWFAVGVQWRPASWSASGLDIQLFRALIEAAQQKLGIIPKPSRTPCTFAA